MKSKKNKRFIKNQSASRHTNKKVRKKDIKIKLKSKLGKGSTFSVIFPK